ncbi:hypothetical protein K488DRAFT_78529 [Vararia minispora EC-137]|uniref:Uncharacterized protein n=1 Tax=Vararia minispora EC-137 TaxID=1314806 RepID=A0ACB8QKZ4_9AGAM|nr:hypothetical protein K488DRAFT_78529 [Vararia minispora EC-137]
MSESPDIPIVRPQTEIEKQLVLPLDPTAFHPSARELEFLKHAISQDEHEIKNRAEEVQKDEKHPYPCLRGFHHVALMMSANKTYPLVLEKGRADPEALFLDVGCCMGTDVRKLLHDGFPGAQVLACDLLPDFIALGHKLYRDKDICPVHFFAADMYEIPLVAPIEPPIPSNVPLGEIKKMSDLLGRLSFVYGGALFHLWDESTQHALALRFALLLRVDKPAIIFGRHQALPEPGYIDDGIKRVRYGHSPESWIRMWKTVFKTIYGPDFALERVRVNTEMISGPPKLLPSPVPLHYMMYWSVEVSA